MKSSNNLGKLKYLFGRIHNMADSVYVTVVIHKTENDGNLSLKISESRIARIWHKTHTHHEIRLLRSFFFFLNLSAMYRLMQLFPLNQ